MSYFRRHTPREMGEFIGLMECRHFLFHMVTKSTFFPRDLILPNNYLPKTNYLYCAMFPDRGFASGGNFSVRYGTAFIMVFRRALSKCSRFISPPCLF
jgi:hypothetical protein